MNIFVRIKYQSLCGVLIIFSTQLFCQVTETCFTTPGTYTFTPPASCGNVAGTPVGVQIQAWGGGGGGGGNTGGSNGAGAGGGSASALGYQTLLVGQVYTVYIGQGGAGHNDDGLDGEDGEDSYFADGGSNLVLAKGGGGGQSYGNGYQGGIGGRANESIGDITFSGGNGGIGNNGLYGQAGSGGTSAGTGANGNQGGTGDYNNCNCMAPSITAPAGGGGGGRGGTGGGGDRGLAGDGLYPGGGGGGGANGNYVQGGNGGNGKVCVSWGNERDFYVPSSYTVPSYISKIQVEAWGGGAGGLDDDNGGGGSGAYANSTIDVTPGTSYSVNPGAPGTANGGAGGESWFSTTGTVPTNVTEGVLASGGLIGGAGGNNTIGQTTTNGNAAAGNDGGDAPNAGGAGGAGGVNDNVFENGQQGGAPGGGGGGGLNGAIGAVGGYGKIRITNSPPFSTLGDNPVPSATICPDETDAPIHSLAISGSNIGPCDDGFTITAFDFVTAGDYLVSDIINFKLYSTTVSTFTNPILLATNTTPTAAGTQSFTGFVYAVTSSTTYFWVTVDLSSSANSGRTITVNGTQPANVTAATVPSGSSVASETQTLADVPVLTSPIVDTICSGETFNYTPTSSIANSTFDWTRAFAPGIAETAAVGSTDISEILTNTTNVLIDVPYIYTTTGTGASPCAPTTQTVILTVHPSPTASILDDTLVCEGEPTDIVLIGANGTAPYTFTYSFNGGGNLTAISTAPASTVAISVPTGTTTTHTYSLISVQDALTCAQSQTDDVTVQISPPPQGTVALSDDQVCENDVSPNAVFSGTGGVTPPYTFTYTTNVPVNGATRHTAMTVGTSSVTSVSIPTTTPDTIVFTITSVIDNFGLTCGQAGSFDTLVIDPQPISIITAAFNDVCLGDADQVITFTGYNVPAPVTFEYFTSINGGPDDAQPSITSVAPSLTATISAPATTVGTTVYTNGISSSNVCSGNQGSGSARLTVNPLPEGAIALGSTSPICENTTGAISFTGSLGTPSYTFTYNIDGGATQSVTSLTGQNTVDVIVDTVPGTYVYTILTVKDTFNCTPVAQPTGSVSITVDPLPTATAGGTENICLNGTATVSGATSSNGTIAWTENGAGTISADGTTLTPTYSAVTADAGSSVLLTLTVTSDNICGGETATAGFTVNVDSLPLAIAGGSATICENATHTITGVTVRYGSILWSHDGAGSLSNPTSPTSTYTAAAGDAVVTLTVTVTSDNSCASQTATAIYTINVDPIPTTTAGGMQTICENSTATIAGAALTNSNPNWVITSGSGSITGGSTLTPTYTASSGDAGNAVILTMTVTSDNSCSPQTATAIYTVNVDPIPTAASGGTQDICENGTATLSGATSNYGTILWTHNGTGTITAGETTLTPTYTAATGDANNTVTMTMTVTSNNTCAPQTAIAAYTVDVAILPTASSTGTQTICENGTATVSGAVATDGTILWSHEGAGTLSDETTLTPTYNAAGDAGNAVTLTMTVTSDNACGPQNETAIYIVNVDKLPTATAGGSQIVCQAGEAIISGAAATDGTINWTENGSGSITAGATSLTPTYNAGAADAGNEVTLTMTVTSDNMCNPQTAINFYSIEVKPLLTGSIALSNPATCIGTAEQATLTGGMGTAPYTFTYRVNGGADQTIETVTGNNIAIPAITATNQSNTYELIHVADVFCDNIVSSSSTMIVHPLPTATMEGLQTLCADSVAQPIVFSGENGTAPYTFHFTKTDLSLVSTQLPPLTTIDSDSVLYEISNTEEPGTFIYVLDSIVDLEGCSSYYSQDSSTFVTIKENPDAQFSVTPEQVSVLEATIELTNATYGADPDASWQWDFGDDNTSIDEDPFSHSYADTGTYIITLTVSNDTCSSSAQQTVNIEAPILVYIPTGFTPNGDGINDEFKPKGDGLYSYEMKIYDRWGNMIFFTDDIDKGWNGTANGGSSIAQIDSYVYVIDIIDISKKQSHTYRGVVNLVR